MSTNAPKLTIEEQIDTKVEDAKTNGTLESVKSKSEKN